MGRGSLSPTSGLMSSGCGATELWAISTPLWAMQRKPRQELGFRAFCDCHHVVEAGIPRKQVLNSHGEGVLNWARIGHTLRCPFRREKRGEDRLCQINQNVRNVVGSCLSIHVTSVMTCMCSVRTMTGTI